MDLRAHADAWLAAWKARDLDAIMACYADDVEFAASTVTRLAGLRGRRGPVPVRDLAERVQLVVGLGVGVLHRHLRAEVHM
ncbi:hypothetical protein Pka01_70130 [Planotetraspora kaengkrachanensis]|uniref:SnoaL-like domain-containing protein n=1 Tax=Planotetraspora kaengkrachanensis TaxID=575193 RepID=A0A8J3PZR6_9ACTN|nr:hypothetical protein Pka01_70130 [Planotetraspora kaengkrachanensis]